MSFDMNKVTNFKIARRSGNLFFIRLLSANAGIFPCHSKGISGDFDVKETFFISLVSYSRQKEFPERSQVASTTRQEWTLFRMNVLKHAKTKMENLCGLFPI